MVVRGQTIREALAAISVALLIGCVVSGCKDSSSRRPAPAVSPTQDLAVTALETVSLDLQIAHQIVVNVSFRSEEEAQDVAIAFRILRKADVDAGLDEIEQYTLDEINVDVGPTAQTLAVALIVPPEVVSVGEYYLSAEIDPHGLFKEKSEQNVFIAEFAPQVISGDFAQTPNVVLEQFAFDPGVLAFNRTELSGSFEPDPDAHNTLSATLTVSATGASPLQDLRIGLTELIVSIDWPGVGVLPIAGDFTPHVWQSDFDDSDGDQSGYAFEYTFDLLAGEKKDIHFDFVIPEAELLQVVTALDGLLLPPGAPPLPEVIRLQVAVTLCVDPSDAVPEYEPNGADNCIAAPLEIVIFNYPPPCEYEKSYQKTFGDPNFGVSVDFLARVELDSNGAQAEAGGRVPINLLGLGFDFLELDAVAHRDPVADYSQFQLDLRFGGEIIYSTELDTRFLDEAPSLEYTLSGDDQSFEFRVNPGAAEAKLGFSKEKSKEKTFFPGGFPVKVKGTIVGEIGVLMELACTDGFSLAGGPYAELRVGLEGSPGGEGSIVSVGVGGELTLLNDTFKTTASCTLSVDELAPDCTISGNVHFDVTNTITALAGRIYVFAEYPWCKVCWKYGIFPYLCRCGTARKEHDLVNWDGFKIAEQVLIERNCDTIQPIACPIGN
ncbi:MAG: hypothetical protein ACKVX7_02965 [Planctomycetota bacterium]